MKVHCFGDESDFPSKNKEEAQAQTVIENRKWTDVLSPNINTGNGSDNYLLPIL